MFEIVHNDVPTGLIYSDKSVAWAIANDIQQEAGGTVTVREV
jgi:hypothetical protein